MILEFPALALAQNEKKTIYAFAIDGKRLPDIASIARAGRDSEGQFVGYQRPEVKKHIGEIRRYLESDFPMMPNAIVLALDTSVTFTATQVPTEGPTKTGVLRIRRREGSNDLGAASVVDGQQRLAAIREAGVASFPMFAIGFTANSEEEQREQFLLVNSAKPLPRALIHELLPGVTSNVPSHLQKRQLPARLVNALNVYPASPLHSQISTSTNPGGNLKDNSVLRFLENSLSDGVLYRIGQQGTPEQQWRLMVDVLVAFWNAVKMTWPDIWRLSPRKSRLLHGAGVVSLGFLMDAMSDRRREVWPDSAYFAQELAKIKPYCRWNEGFWEFSPDHHRHWNDIQNTPKDVQLLANYLNRIYLRTWNKA
ncbi:MAG: DGQHR domain-containing protein [Deltaproteobacteria bacterium]|nr:DGQHR domain-containing protein [Deltaproteobacteria bacterium]